MIAGGIKEVGNGLAQCRLNRPRRVAELSFGLCDRERRRPQGDPHTFGRSGGRFSCHVVGNELQRCRGGFRDLAGNRNTKIAAAATRCHEAKNILQRDTFAAKNVAMSDLPTLHGQNQARCNVAHVDKVDDEIKIQLKAPIEKVPEHRHRWSKVVIVRSDGHGWSADDHWKP